MGEISAIAVGNRSQCPGAIFTFLENDLCDSRQVFAKLKFILRNWASEFVKPDLLKKINVCLRPFALVWIARVENARTVIGPRGTAAAGWILHARDFVFEFLASIDLEEMQRALFTATFGERNGNEPPVRRWNIPINRNAAIG